MSDQIMSPIRSFITKSRRVCIWWLEKYEVLIALYQCYVMDVLQGKKYKAKNLLNRYLQQFFQLNQILISIMSLEPLYHVGPILFSRAAQAYEPGLLLAMPSD